MGGIVSSANSCCVVEAESPSKEDAIAIAATGTSDKTPLTDENAFFTAEAIIKFDEEDTAIALMRDSSVRPLRNSSARSAFLWCLSQKEISALTRLKDDSAQCDAFLRSMFVQFVLSNRYTSWSHQRLRLYDYLSEVSSGFDDLILAGESFDLEQVQADLAEFTYTRLPDSRASLLEHGGWFKALLELDGMAMTLFLTSLDEEKGFPLLYANNYATKRFGFSKAELYGRPNPFLAPTGSEWMQSALPTRQGVQVLAKDGAVAQALMFTVPMFDCESEHRCNLSLVTLNLSEEAMFSVAYLLCLIPNIIS